MNIRVTLIDGNLIPDPCGSQADRYGDLTARGIAAGLNGVAVHESAVVATTA